ncbi:MAG TPA: amidase, partial [Candidatus Limnocylindrales bacterium]|nr:amidase [Candidatus Limnocylindrales bacterium]
RAENAVDVLDLNTRTRGEGFGDEVKRRIILGTYSLSAGYYDAYYLKAQKVRTLIKADFDAVFDAGFDALVAPTSPTVAFPLGARLADPVSMYLSDACTLPVNMAGLPGLSVPTGLSDGLPVGLQLIGAPWKELELFRLARGYEAVTAGAEWRGVEPAALATAGDAGARTPAAAH